MEKAHDVKNLDLSGANRGVWLVKVPKYLSNRWKRAGPNYDVGKLRITRNRLPNGKLEKEVRFTLSEELAKKDESGQQVSRDHKFVLSGMATQSLSVLAEEPVAAGGDDGPDEKVSVEGKVIHRGECRPIGDANYMKFKRHQLEVKNKPTRQVIQINTPVATFKPKTNHEFNIEYDQRKKEEGKRSRDSKDKVQDMLFAAFEKHQYYNMKDLVTITRQPETYLKEILREMCIYNMKAPHKYTWELKPEYRHYKEQGGESK